MTKTLKGESRDWLSPLFCWLYAAMLLWVLGLVTLGQRAMEGYYAHGFCVENWVLLLAAAGLTGLWVWRLRVRSVKLPQPASSVRISWARAALYLALFAVQCLMARCLWFYFAFDPSAVRQGAEALALGQPLSEEWLAYFRQCPNNAPLTVLLSLVYGLGMKLGLAEPYVLEVYGAALLTNLSVATAMAVLRRLKVRPSVRRVGFGLAAVWLLFSPFIIMPYTDTYACLFPVLGLLILLTGWKAPVRYGLAALCCSLGGAVKPSAYILLIAALLLGTIRFLFRKKNAALWKRGLCILAAVIIGVLPGMALEKGSVKLLTGSTAPEEALGSAHYLMIGLDDQYWGGHSAEGVTYSGSFATAKERTRANLARALEEVQNRTLGENLHFFSVKAYKAYADGTFAFNSYLVEEPVRRSDRLSLFLRKIFYREGAWNPAYRAVMQGLWLMVLLGCLAAALLRRREYAVQLCALSLLGLTAYQLLFEVWPRYLFLYAPVFLVLALLGVEKLGQRREKQ